MTEADGKPRASTGHARAITGAPPVEHPPARGTSRCAPGAFSLTAPVFRSSRAQKGAWCARHRSDGRRGDRRWELTGDDRRRKAQAGAGRKGTAVQEDASGDRQEGTTVQEGASGERQEGNDGAGRGLDEPEKRPTKY